MPIPSPPELGEHFCLVGMLFFLEGKEEEVRSSG